MSVETGAFLDQLLVFEKGVFPREVLAEIIERRDEFEEDLLNAMGDILARPKEFADGNTIFPIYVVFLLAQFRIKRAWKPMLELLALPDGLPDQLFGDLIDDSFGAIIASLYDGDDQALRELLENPAADEYVRGCAVIDAYLCLMDSGQIGMDEVKTYFGELLDFKLERQPGFVWDSVTTRSGHLGFESLLPAIEKAFAEGFCDRGFNSLYEIKKQIKSGGSDEWRANVGLIDDTISQMSGWDCFRPILNKNEIAVPNFSDLLRSKPSVPALQPIRVQPVAGRNDPCPCGSGKKYKKCCGDEASKAAAALATREKLDQSVLHVRVELIGSEPLIWREVLISGSSSLADLHHVIQKTMPWVYDHLHCFSHHTLDRRLTDSGSTPAPTAFEMQTRLHQFVDSDQPLVYTYDFGDNWEHRITITVWHGDVHSPTLPICVDGENAAPPEDSGGVWGYANMLKIVEDKTHPDCKHMTEWLGENFDPSNFSLSSANKRLEYKRCER